MSSHNSKRWKQIGNIQSSMSVSIKGVTLWNQLDINVHNVTSENYEQLKYRGIMRYTYVVVQHHEDTSM